MRSRHIYHGIFDHVVGGVEEGLGEGERAAFSAASTEGFNEVTGCF
jgi:hypothetical protein